MAESRKTGHDRYELVPDLPVRRATATVNIRWDDKTVFDGIKTWLQYERGRPITQWDVFTFILAAALENEASPLHKARLNFADV